MSLQTTNALLGDIFGMGSAATTTFFIPPKQVWLPAAKGKGLEVSGTFSRKNGHIYMEMTLSNKAMQPMSGFGLQLNKNSFGLIPAQALNVPAIPSNQSVDISLQLGHNGPVQRMEPLTNLQVAMKNNVDVFYFACVAPIHVFFAEDGNMEKKVFLATWKDIPSQNEVQFTLDNVECNAGKLAAASNASLGLTVLTRESSCRWCLDQDAPEQRLHRGQEDPGGPGHGLPGHQVHQQRLGTCRVEDPTWKPDHHGKSSVGTVVLESCFNAFSWPLAARLEVQSGGRVPGNLSDLRHHSSQLMAS